MNSAQKLSLAVERLREPWLSKDWEEQAVDAVRLQAAAEVAKRWEARDDHGLEAVAKIVLPFDPKGAAAAQARASVSRLPTCGSCGCVQSALAAAEEADLPQDDIAAARQEAIAAWRSTSERAVAAARKVQPTDVHDLRDKLAEAHSTTKCYEELAGKPAVPSAVELAPELQKAAEAEADANAKAAEAQRKADEAAEAQRKANEAAAERLRLAEQANAPRGVRCRDGTASPSCTCGGSLRGCCSHHGGVAGCE